MTGRTLDFIKKAIDRFYYDLKLKDRLIISFSVFILFPILFIGLSSYYISQKNMIDAEKNSLMQSANQLNNTVDFFLETYMNKNEMLFNNLELQEAIIKKNTNLIDALASQKKIANILKQVKNDFRYPEMKSSYYYGGNVDLRLYAANASLTEFGGEIMDLDTVRTEKWCADLLNSPKQYAWQNGGNSGDMYGNSRRDIIYNRKLVDFDSAEVIGLLRLYIPLVRIENILKGNMHNTMYNVMYVDQSSEIITRYGDAFDNPQLLDAVRAVALKDGINTADIMGERYIIYLINSDATGWKSIFVTPVSYITEKTGHIATLTVVTVFASLIICIVVATLVSSFITRRVDVLVWKTNNIRDGNFSTGKDIRGNDEIGQLDKNFNNMIKRIDDLIESDYKLQIAMNRIRYELLQEQINPHLLYNTLAMISMIARRSSQTEIVDISSNLVNFYKGVLNRGRFISSIKEEIDMVKRYIDITKAVYNLEIEAAFDLDDGLEELYSIKLFLQPIVENSILHGIRPNGGGTLQISAVKSGESIEFVITDDGVGMTGDCLTYLNSVMKNPAEEKGFGISNVIRRICLFFGSRYGVRFESTPGVGTSVSVTIPALTENEIIRTLDGRNLE